jgi:small subunit ribosomal protein S18
MSENTTDQTQERPAAAERPAVGDRPAGDRPRGRFGGAGGDRPRGGGGRFGGGGGRRREPIFSKVEEVDYKDVARLRRCVDESGKLLPRRRLNHTAKVQRKVSVAVKRARYIGLIPFTSQGRNPRG